MIDYSEPLAGEPLTVTTADGTRLHTVSLGSGTPVVLAHGYAIDCGEWNLIGAALASRGYQVIAFDQRGHGRSTIGHDGVSSLSMSQDYAAVLDHYDVREGRSSRTPWAASSRSGSSSRTRSS